MSEKPMSKLEKPKDSIVKITPEIAYLKGLKEELGEKYLDEFFANSKQRQELDEFKEREELKLMQLEIENQHAINLGWQKVEIEKIHDASRDRLWGRVSAFLSLASCLGFVIYLIQSGNRDLLLPFATVLGVIVTLATIYISKKR
jgi:hypothetical protein